MTFVRRVDFKKIADPLVPSGASRVRWPRKQTVLACTLIVCAVVVPFWKMVAMQGYIITDDIFASDLMNDQFPLRHYISELLKSGEAPLWMPQSYGGFPLLARSEAGVCYPLNWIFFGFFSPYPALNITILLTLLIVGISMYMYLREMEVSFAAAVMGGIAFELSGYVLSHLKHLSQINAACWFPLGMFFIERAVRRNQPRYLFCVGGIFGLQNLAGHTQIAYYSTLAFIAYFITRLIRERRKTRETAKEKKKSSRLQNLVSLVKQRLSLALIIALAFGALVAAVQLVPTYELVSQSKRAGGVSFDFASNYAYDPANLLMFFYPYIHGDIGNGTYTGNSVFWEDYGYVGITVLLLAIYGVARKRKDWYVRFHSVFIIFAMFMVVGPATPLYKIVFNVLPGMDYFRFPTRFLLIVSFSLIALACIGFSELSRQRSAKESGARSSNIFGLMTPIEWGLVAAVVADLWYFQPRLNPIVDTSAWRQSPKAAEILMADTSMFRLYVIGGTDSHKLTFAKAKGWEGNLQPYIDQREFLQPNSNVLYGISTPDGYQNFTPLSLVRIWGDFDQRGMILSTAGVQNNTFVPTPSFYRLMDFANVKYVISLWPITNEGKLEPIGKYHDAYLYRNPTVMPRAYMVNKIRRVTDAKEGERILLSRDFDPRSETIVEQSFPSFESSESSNSQIEFEEYSANEVRLRIFSEHKSLLVLSDTYYPGWKALLDGKEIEIQRVNMIYRGVVVPEGVHRVSFCFEPKSVKMGLLLSIVGCGGLLAGFIFFGRSSKEKMP